MSATTIERNYIRCFLRQSAYQKLYNQGVKQFLPGLWYVSAKRWWIGPTLVLLRLWLSPSSCTVEQGRAQHKLWSNRTSSVCLGTMRPVSMQKQARGGTMGLTFRDSKLRAVATCNIIYHMG